MSGPTLPSGPGARCPHCKDQHPGTYTHCPKTGRPLATGHALIGRIIAGRYRILGQLGEGGMGEVFIAEHLRIGRKVALKRLHPELASDERSVQRFLREARAAAATGHEHIVEILDLGYADDNAPYLVMEYLRGSSLADILREEQRIEPARTVALLGQVLSALDAVHRNGIIHRDLKPDNVFVTRRPGHGEFVKVLDFGISKMGGDGSGESLALTRTGVMMGTPFYMSPEQARGVREVDTRVDLYAVGVMFYECLTGRLPFAAENYHALLQLILRSEPRPPSTFAPAVEPALDAVVLRSIGKDPDQRFQTASEFVEALAPWGIAPLPAFGAAARPAVETPRTEPSTKAEPAPASPGRASPRYFFAASDDWQPERARSGSIRPPVALSAAVPRGAARRTDTAARPDVLTRSLADATVVSPARAFEPTVRSAGADAPPPPSDEATRAELAGRAPTEAMPRPAEPPARSFGDAPRAAEPPPPRATIDVEKPPRVAGEVPGPSEPRPEGARPSRVPSPIRDRVDSPRPDLGPSGAAKAGASSATVRGSFFVAVLRQLEEEGGGAWLEAVLGRMSNAARERVSGVIQPLSWLPLLTFDALLRAAASDDDAPLRLGRTIAEQELLSTHRLLLQTASPVEALERVPQLLRQYHQRCDVVLERTGPGTATLELDLGLPEPLLHTRLLAGFVARLLELCGGANVEVSVQSCRGLGDPSTRLSIRYR